MKYRIQKITRRNGVEEFLPQVKGLFFWQECKNISGYTIYFSTYHEAEEYIIGLELNKLMKKLEKSNNDVVRCENIPVTPEEN